MKKNYYLLIALLVAMMSFGLTACGDDDDEDASGSGNKVALVDGKSYAINYAWWRIHGGNYLSLEFSNFDVFYHMSESDRGFFLTLEIDKYQHSDIQPGTYVAYMELWENVQNQNVPCGKVELTITKEGNNFTIIVPETTVNLMDPDEKNVGTVLFSIKYTGTLAISPED